MGREITRTELADNLLLSNIRQLVLEGKLVTIEVEGINMHPFLEGGRDQVIIGAFERLMKGDLVLAEIHASQYALLRIIDIKGSRVTLKGDGNRRRTQVCNSIDIVGVAVALIRKNKYLACNGWQWKLYSWTWLKLSPLRRPLLAIYRRFL